MPIVSKTFKKDIEAQCEAISKLQEKCKLHGVFRGKEAKEIFIYQICVDSFDWNTHTEDGPAMVAVAVFDDNGNEYAIYAPEYLNQRQRNSVFQLLLKEADKNDTIAVFSWDDYDALCKYSYDKEVRRVNYAAG